MESSFSNTSPPAGLLSRTSGAPGTIVCGALLDWDALLDWNVPLDRTFAQARGRLPFPNVTSLSPEVSAPLSVEQVFPQAREPSSQVTPRRRSSFRTELTEFLFIGGATLFLLPLFWLLGKTSFADDAEYQVSFLAFYAAYLINDPHFAVTYVLFYRRARERALGSAVPLLARMRYWGAGLVVPLVLIGWSALALSARSASHLGYLFQLMYFLVSWHYAKQAFGILMALSARRRVRFVPGERRLILGHCLCAWLFARAYPADPGGTFMEQGTVYHSIPHPAWLLPVASVAFGLSCVGLVLALFFFWRRERRLPPLGALSAFLISIWVWTIFTDLSPMLIYVIPGLHSLQYLYFVWLLRRNEARAFEGEPHFGRPVATQLGLLAVTSLVLGWFLFHGLPESLDELLSVKDPQAFGALGPTPYLAAIFAFVNIHHYFMDAVIWRREVPETKYLVH